jgi:hypothetical protein
MLSAIVEFIESLFGKKKVTQKQYVYIDTQQTNRHYEDELPRYSFATPAQHEKQYGGELHRNSPPYCFSS